ncbi:MAG: MFS transporter, partial [Candidatus Binatia bacterium]
MALGLALAPQLSVRLGKKRAAISISTLAILLAPAPVTLRLLDVFPANDSPALLPVLFAFRTLAVTLVITAAILISSMIADVVEDSETVTGRRSEGVFFAASSFVAKSVSGVGVFLSTLLL